MTLSVSTTFTSEPLGDYLDHWMRLLQLPHGVEFAPYGQLFQELLSPASSLAQNRDGVAIVLVRVEDWARTRGTDQGVAEACEDFQRAFADFATSRRSVPVVLGLLPPSPANAACFDALAAATARLRESLRGLPGVSLLEQEDWDAFGAEDIYDERSNELAHIPYREEFFAALSGAIARRIHALKVPARKVLVLDCDNTLWGGVVGEDGPSGITLEAPYLALQRFASRQQQQGTLLCLCSKNVEADVEQAFQVRGDFELGWSQLVLNRVNWESKAANIQSLADELNLGLDSFVFLDDNIVECETVRAALPAVATLHIARPDDITGIVRNLWPLDKLTVTKEDLERTEMYRQNAARTRLAKAAPSLEAFFEQLGLSIQVAEPAAAQWPRLSQLTQRTNQFNITTIRRSEDELRALALSGAQLRIVSVSDRFGDYGDTGVTIYRAEADRVVLDTFLLSCRVLGRGVEHEMLADVGRYAEAKGLPRVVIPFKKTKKNEPALKFLRSLGAATSVETADGFEFSLATADAALAAFRPEAGGAALDGEEKPAASSDAAAPSNSSASERYQSIARELSTAKGIVAAVRSSRVGAARPMLGEPAERPWSDEESRMLALWEELLAMDGLGVEDDYFALGGTSLLAVKLSVGVEERFGVRLPLTAIVEAPTVRALVKRMRELNAGGLLLLGQGGPRRMFLIHDGDGETLLYRNLAEQLRAEFTVFGVQPKAGEGVPLLHTRIEQMAVHYAAQIQQQEPHGPYYLGGLCAGGTLAFAVAAELEARGAKVAQVVMLDAAAPRAARHTGVVASERWQRFSDSVFGGGRRRSSAGPEEREGDSVPPSSAPASSRGGALPTAMSKVAGVIRYEVKQRLDKVTLRRRFEQLRAALDDAGDLGPLRGALTFRQIYNLAEDDYTPRATAGANVLLVLATEGEGNDRPFSEIYAEPDLGWKKYASALRTVAVSGGHASMLQAEHAASLARTIRDALLVSGHHLLELEPVGSGALRGASAAS